MEKARRQGSKESPVVGLKFCFKLFPTYLSSTPVGFGMHLGKWGLAPTLHIGFFSQIFRSVGIVGTMSFLYHEEMVVGLIPA